MHVMDRKGLYVSASVTVHTPLDEFLRSTLVVWRIFWLVVCNDLVSLLIVSGFDVALRLWMVGAAHAMRDIEHSAQPLDDSACKCRPPVAPQEDATPVTVVPVYWYRRLSYRLLAN